MAASRAAASSSTVAVAPLLLRLEVAGAAAILRAARGGRWQVALIADLSSRLRRHQLQQPAVRPRGLLVLGRLLRATSVPPQAQPTRCSILTPAR
jgi:hypothetical protein